MSKAVEELSKNLATGVSRRRALWRFATGIGTVAGLGFLTRGKAKAAEAAPPSPFECYYAMIDIYEKCISLPPDLQAALGGCFPYAEYNYEECLGGL